MQGIESGGDLVRVEGMRVEAQIAEQLVDFLVGLGFHRERDRWSKIEDWIRVPVTGRTLPLA